MHVTEILAARVIVPPSMAERACAKASRRPYDHPTGHHPPLPLYPTPIDATRSGTILRMMRCSPGCRQGYLSRPRYFLASLSMCSSAPSLVTSTTRPRT